MIIKYATYGGDVHGDLDENHGLWLTRKSKVKRENHVKNVTYNNRILPEQKKNYYNSLVL